MDILSRAKRRSMPPVLRLALLCVFGKTAWAQRRFDLFCCVSRAELYISAIRLIQLSLRIALPGSSVFCNQTLAHYNVSE